MKRTYLFIILCPLVLALLAGIATNHETWTEMNRATGAMRTRSTRAFVFAKPWSATSTWVSERAARLGIDTDSEWQLLSHREMHWGAVAHGCGKAPASFYLRTADESVLSQEEQDDFIRSFVDADEESRERMIHELMDGVHASP